MADKKAKKNAKKEVKVHLTKSAKRLDEKHLAMLLKARGIKIEKKA